jgi:hypothetical protein
MPTTFDPEKIKAKLNTPYNDDTKMPFGAHKGKTLTQVPSGYLLWFYDQPWSSNYPKLRVYVDKNRVLLEIEADEYSRERFGGEEDPHWGNHD